jgi:Flp pilus assembly protein TadD
LFSRLRTEVDAGRLDEAEATLARLTEVAPNDVRVLRAEADLLEARGMLGKACDLLEEVARRRPTWRTILELARMEARVGGRQESSRRRLEELLKDQPDNQYVLENLASLEVTAGNLKRAETLYQKLLDFGPDRSFLTNLGFARLLLGDYTGAAAVSRRALDLEAGHLKTRFNLASALEGQGDLDGARRLYQDLETELAAASTASAPMDAETRMLHALCLAHLGKNTEALRIAGEVFEQRQEEPQILNLAAQVYVLTGLYYTEQALKSGLRREWFTLPEFRTLQEDPYFRDLLDRPQPRKSEG